LLAAAAAAAGLAVRQAQQSCMPGTLSPRQFCGQCNSRQAAVAEYNTMHSNLLAAITTLPKQHNGAHGFQQDSLACNK
jgi:hypothetical protein